MPQIKIHRPFGVYGICSREGEILVIHKGGGPYIHRYDLPGGSLEDSDSLTEALKREFIEETGLKVAISRQIGAADFFLPWDWRGHTHVHHLAVFYEVEITGGEIAVPEVFDGQDSLKAEWVSTDHMTRENASPLVLKAVSFLKSGIFSSKCTVYDRWEIKQKRNI